MESLMPSRGVTAHIGISPASQGVTVASTLWLRGRGQLTKQRTSEHAGSGGGQEGVRRGSGGGHPVQIELVRERGELRNKITGGGQEGVRRGSGGGHPVQVELVRERGELRNQITGGGQEEVRRGSGGG
eukprot:1086852-Prorocentrum_minimum.AAC.1